jgi:F-type H+-transporting ATPase subunit delta
MKNSILSKRYAKALFKLIYVESRDEAVLIQSIEVLKGISEGIQGNPSLKNVLFNPSFGIEDKKLILKRLVDRPESENILESQANILKSFFTLLIKKGRLIFLPHIVAELEQLRNSLLQTMPVLLTVPLPLLENEKDAFAQKFEQIFKQKIRLAIKVSPEILGGMAVQIGSKVFDATLQMKLNRLKQKLME